VTARVIAITDRSVASAELTLARFGELGRAARPGSVVFQLRDLELPVRERLEFGRALHEVARETKQFFVVNDRIDLVVLLGADGVHLGEAGISVADARRLLPPTALVSRACHDPELVRSLEVDIVVLSPVLDARKGRRALGTDALRRARRRIGENPTPLLFALGGVTAENAPSCRSAGADGVAMIGELLARGNVAGVVRSLDIAC